MTTPIQDSVLFWWGYGPLVGQDGSRQTALAGLLSFHTQPSFG
jgi:hypothetical protein